MTRAPADAICQFVPPFMRFLRDGLSELNMSPARFQILQALTESGALTMIALADRLSVTKRNVTTLVDGLEKEGLAGRHPHPTDRRATLVELTEAGADAFVRAADVQRAHLSGLLEDLDPAQQDAMTRALNQLTEAIATRRQQAQKTRAG
ncbi:MAG: MarR family transcriptional regulator [Pseudomonadota bacterium]